MIQWDEKSDPKRIAGGQNPNSLLYRYMIFQEDYGVFTKNTPYIWATYNWESDVGELASLEEAKQWCEVHYATGAY